MCIGPSKTLKQTSQIAQRVLVQTEKMSQDVRKHAMQAYLKYKAYCEGKTNASKMRERE